MTGDGCQHTVHARESGLLPRRHNGPRARCLHEQILRVAASSLVGSGTIRCRAHGSRAGNSPPYPTDVWCTSDPRRTGGSRRSGEPQARRAGHAARGPHRGEPAPPAPDLVDRDCAATRPNQLGVADLTNSCSNRSATSHRPSTKPRLISRPPPRRYSTNLRSEMFGTVQPYASTIYFRAKSSGQLLKYSFRDGPGRPPVEEVP